MRTTYQLCLGQAFPGCVHKIPGLCNSPSTAYYDMTCHPNTLAISPLHLLPLSIHISLLCQREVWCGVVWCGVVWCGVVWCGVVWCGMWCGVVCGGVTRWLRRPCKSTMDKYSEANSLVESLTKESTVVFSFSFSAAIRSSSEVESSPPADSSPESLVESVPSPSPSAYLLILRSVGGRAEARCDAKRALLPRLGLMNRYGC